MKEIEATLEATLNTRFLELETLESFLGIAWGFFVFAVSVLELELYVLHRPWTPTSNGTSFAYSVYNGTDLSQGLGGSDLQGGSGARMHI